MHMIWKPILPNSITNKPEQLQSRSLCWYLQHLNTQTPIQLIFSFGRTANGWKHPEKDQTWDRRMSSQVDSLNEESNAIKFLSSSRTHNSLDDLWHWGRLLTPLSQQLKSRSVYWHGFLLPLQTQTHTLLIFETVPIQTVGNAPKTKGLELEICSSMSVLFYVVSCLYVFR